MPMPMAPEMRINVDFWVEIVPADGIRLPFSRSKYGGAIRIGVLVEHNP
jgi:hypothetical protein